MQITHLIAAIDDEISRLQQARTLLSESTTPTIQPKRGPGRPKGSSKSASHVKKTRTMTAEGKARIAAAQKKRWAARRKAA